MVGTASRGKIRSLWLVGLASLLGVGPAQAQGQYPANGPPPAAVLTPQMPPAPPAAGYGPPPGPPAQGFTQGGFPGPNGAPQAPPQLINQFQALPVQSRTVIVGMQQQPGQPPMPPAGLLIQPPQGASLPPPTVVPGSPPPPDGPPPPVVHNLTEPLTPFSTPCDPWTNLPFFVDFKDGVFFKSNDGLFSLRINNLLQVDYRDFAHTARGVHTPTSLQDNFTLAREWLIFRGNVTDLLEYATIIAAGDANTPTGPAAVNILDAYLDFNPLGKDAKDLLQIRVGRFKTPFLYQFYKYSPQEYIAPELSMFSTNFLQNRQLGIMAHGLVFDKRLDYAAGVFNGVPNTFEVNQSDREGIFYLGYQPFAPQKDGIFKNLIVAGSYAFGDQNGPVDPGALGTAVPSNGPANNLLISPTFLQFGPNTTQTGFHQLWATEVIWAIRSFNLYAEYTAGQQHYGLTTAPGKSFPVSLSGYSVATTYFFTGEEITPERRRITPLRPYNGSCGGTGAVEGFFRYSNLVLGSNVFADGLANPAVFANRVNATDVGVNWYLNEYVKVIFDWQHDMFDHAVSYTGAVGGNASRNEDIFWFRFQLYY